jgi:rfaE bifunctional protein nucleotidyltransferase chain/domain/rfaE bifunctional protein kinase chain/domain
VSPPASLVVVGDAMLDVDLDGRADRLCPDAPAPVIVDAEERVRPGGAALAATLAAVDGVDVTLVTVIPADEPGRRLRALLDSFGVRIVDVVESRGGRTPEKVRIRAGAQVVARLDRGDGQAPPAGALSAAASTVLQRAGVVLVSDYGRGVAAHGPLRAALAGDRRHGHLVWDPHPEGPSPVRGALVVTPNHREAERAGGTTARTPGELAELAALLAGRWSARGVVVTRGERGALLVHGSGPPLIVPARASMGDACGAGDRFASSLSAKLLDGAVLSEAVVAAVDDASAYVAAGGPRSVRADRRRPAAAETGADLVAAVRAAGGTVVATGGCFDVLHAGHVQLLQRARELGDVLVVLLNSDASVHRLKGAGRPLVPAEDRAAVLEALGCVDAVVEFDEPTPVAALEELRPDLFVKGGDYGVGDLPERAVLEAWGGQCVVLPYLGGRSTTGLYREVVRRGLA